MFTRNQPQEVIIRALDSGGGADIILPKILGKLNYYQEVDLLKPWINCHHI